MRRTGIEMFVAVLVVVSAACALAEDVKLNGIWYRNVRWGTPTVVEVSLFHKEGVTRLPLAELSPELQQRFGYDPAKAAAYAAEQERKWKEARLQRETPANAQQTADDQSYVSFAVIDGNNFYLKRNVQKTLYGPFPCEAGYMFTVDGNTYEIVRATNMLFTVKSPLTKNVLGPFWLKDGYDVVLDGVSFKLLKPSSVAKENQKIRDEHTLITEIQADTSSTQQVLELQSRLRGSGAGDGKGLGSGIATNENLRSGI